MKKTKMVAALLSAGMMVMAVGCSSNEVVTDKDKVKSEESVTIRVGYWGDSGETEAFKKAIEGVEKVVPGVKVELQHYPGTADFWDSLPGQVAAGTAPDIIAPTNEGHLSYIDSGLFLPLDEYNFDVSGIAPNAIDAWTYDGKLYGIPTTAAPGLFVVNTDMWKEAGLDEYPKTWDEVYEAAKVLTKDGVAGICMDLSQGYHMTQYMNSFGGGWKGGKEINSVANEHALDYIFNMYEEGYAINPKDVGLGWDGEVFAGGKAAMTTAGTWYIGFMKEAAPNINYEIIPMPGGDGKQGCTLHSIAYTVLKNSKNPDLAAQVAYYMSREEAQKVTAEVVGSMPSLVSLQDFYFDLNPKMLEAKKSLEYATSFDYPIDSARFQNELVRLVEEVIYVDSDAHTAKDILMTLADQFSK